jgi:hypothetical protein
MAHAERVAASLGYDEARLYPPRTRVADSNRAIAGGFGNNDYRTLVGDPETGIIP